MKTKIRTLIKTAALLLTALMLASLCASCAATPTVEKIQEDGKIVMLTNAGFPPFEYSSTVEGSVDGVAGVDVEIAKAIAEDLGVTLEIQDMAFDGIVTAIKSGKGSMGIAGMSINEERLENVDFSIKYVDSELYALVLATETEITNADTLKNMTIGVQTGTTSDVYASGIEGAAISRYNTFLDAASALKTGKVRAVVVDKLTADEILAANSDLKRLDEVLATEAYAICVQKGNTTLLDAINATLTRLIEEGKIEEFIAAHADAE